MKATVDREVINPKQAADYLEAAGANRPLVQKRVAALVTAIKRGEWVENGETIKFNGGGTLIDGQHRLAAIAQGGRAVTAWVARGLPTGAQETVDIGSTRTVGNMLAIRGYSHANQLAGVARIIWTYRSSGELDATAATYQPTPQQLLAIVEDEADLLDWIKWSSRVVNQDAALRISITVMAGLAYVFASVSSEEDAKAFFEQLVTPLSASDPTAVLRKRLLQQGFHTRMPPRLRLALVVKAWNAWIRGERPTRFTWRAGGAVAEDFPLVAGREE